MFDRRLNTLWIMWIEFHRPEFAAQCSKRFLRVVQLAGEFIETGNRSRVRITFDLSDKGYYHTLYAHGGLSAAARDATPSRLMNTLPSGSGVAVGPLGALGVGAKSRG